MPGKTEHHDWATFLSRHPIEGDAAGVRAAHEGKTILLTGAGGSIGSALALKIAEAKPRLLILLEICEQNLYQLQAELDRLGNAAPHIAILGDVADRPLLDELFSRHHPEIVYHAAAFKHVPLMESNPLAAIRNNSLGASVLASAAAAHGAEKFIMISTDKAVDPHSVMGVSKRLAELTLLALADRRTRMQSIRLGNVLGSQGSVGLLFLQQIARGGPVTVTHPEVRRYFLTLDEAVGLILSGASLDSTGGVWVPELGQPLKVLDLAEHLIRQAGLGPGVEIPITFTGLRPGDKMTENLVSTRESKEQAASGKLCRVVSPHHSIEDLKAALQELTAILARRDVAALIQALCRIVPEYQPSAAVLELAKDPQTRTHHA
jgi:FlaA1/EpsC-like NDP-sugar epimerase